nr:heavy metal-binding domain-containing protein [uncultured Flavobacterium sp.]
MKKIAFSVLLLALLTVSCNQKTNESTTEHPNMMSNDTTMMDKNGTKMSNDSTMMNDKTKMMNNQTKMYACPMHSEVQGKLNDKCSKCGMKLTVPVPKKNEEIK